MARTAKIHYQRVTFSLPKETAKKLREKIPNNEMSKFVANAVEEKLEHHVTEGHKFIEDLRKFRKSLLKSKRSDKTAVELLREIRYHGKH